MKARVLVAVLFLLLACEAFGCPGCSYQYLLNTHWHIKYGIVTLALPILIGAWRLDFIRMFYAFIPYLMFCFWAHSLLLWHLYPTVRPAYLPEWAVFLAGLVWALNLNGILLMYLLSRVKFFRRKPDQGLAIWQPVAYFFASLISAFILSA